MAASATPLPRSAATAPTWRAMARIASLRAPRPEPTALVALAAVLNLWGLGRNGWANTYYAAAVRSMSSSWHNFLFASLDPSGVMTVDKPPLALWVQALSARVFGYHPLSLLIPQALMGWIMGCIMIWSALFTVGNFLYGRMGYALALFATFLVSGATVIRIVKRIWD